VDWWLVKANVKMEAENTFKQLGIHINLCSLMTKQRFGEHRETLCDLVLPYATILILNRTSPYKVFRNENRIKMTPRKTTTS
jgi:hypothetical protein